MSAFRKQDGALLVRMSVLMTSSLPACLYMCGGEGGEILAREGSVRTGRRAESEETALAS